MAAARIHRAVEVTNPVLEVQKQVRNVSEDSDFVDRVLAAKDDILVWKMDVGNVSGTDVNALLVTDTLPAWFVISDVYTVATTVAFPVVQWRQYAGTTSSGSPLPAEELTTFWITGTVGAGACTAPEDNDVTASYSCSATDSCPSPTYSARAGIDTAPMLSLDVANVTLDQCSAGPLLLNFANTGAAQWGSDRHLFTASRLRIRRAGCRDDTHAGHNAWPGDNRDLDLCLCLCGAAADHEYAAHQRHA